MSDVYEAHDQLTGSPVAIKLVRSGDPEFARRLDREVRALESLEHPGLIRLLNTGVVGDQAYLVMDFVDGPTLATSLREGPLETARVSRLGAQLADTLAYVHARGVVHRDIKPSNILVSSDANAWLGDFGIALMHDATTITALGTTVGTVTYMAPEQLEGQSVGPAADVWSLGVVLLECLTGRRVFEGSPSEIVARRLRGPVTLADDLPTPWKMLLGAMLEARPESRPTSGEVASLLATPAFEAPWQPAIFVPPTEMGASDETRVVSNETRVLAGGRPSVIDPDQTVRAPTGRGPAPVPEGRRVPWVVPTAIAILALLALWWLTSVLNPASPPVTTSTTSTTAPSVSSGSRALTTLLNDLNSSQSAQTLDAASAQAVAADAQKALTDATARNFANVQSDLQAAATTLGNAQQSGLASPSAFTLLQGDLAALATSLGVTPPTTTTTPVVSVPPPGHGHGNGKKHP